MVHNVERNLLIVLLEAVQLAPVLSGEDAALIPIGGAQVGGAEDRFKPEDGWRLISHTFTFRDDGSAILSLLFERHVSVALERGRDSHAEHIADLEEAVAILLNRESRADEGEADDE